MNDRYLQLVKAQYERQGADSTNVFQTLLSIAEESSLDVALACLEQCVTEKRMAWLHQNLPLLKRSGKPIDDAFTAFYEGYLGISPPDDGEMVQRTPARLVMRWWNPCPTLEACQRFGLDTREVCRKAYHMPVQAFLSRIDPRLRFDRNYDALRPHTPFCEEMISLAGLDQETH